MSLKEHLNKDTCDNCPHGTYDQRETKASIEVKRSLSRPKTAFVTKKDLWTRRAKKNAPVTLNNSKLLRKCISKPFLSESNVKKFQKHKMKHKINQKSTVLVNSNQLYTARDKVKNIYSHNTSLNISKKISRQRSAIIRREGSKQSIIKINNNSLKRTSKLGEINFVQKAPIYFKKPPIPKIKNKIKKIFREEVDLFRENNLIFGKENISSKSNLNIIKNLEIFKEKETIELYNTESLKNSEEDYDFQTVGLKSRYA